MDTPEDLELKSQIHEVLGELPPQLRTYISNGRLYAVVTMLARKYSLNNEQTRTLSTELTLLLMGIENPDEFGASLKADAQFEDDTVRSLMTDVNQEVFIPLQKQIEGAQPAPAPVPPAPPIPKLVTPSIPKPVTPPVQKPIAPMPPAPRKPATSPFSQVRKVTFAPPLQSPRYPGSVDVDIEPVIKPVQQTPLPPGVIPQGQKFVPKHFSSPKPAPAHAVTTPAVQTPKPMGSSLKDAVQSALHKDQKMLADHEEGHIELGGAQRPQQAPAPVRPAPPPTPPLSASKPPAPTPPLPPEPTPDGLPPLSKYPVDPYREPIE